MSNTIFLKDAAQLWNISERRVSALCKSGRIKGAIKKGKSWMISIDTEKPLDMRKKQV